MDTKKSISFYLENISLFLWGFLFLAMPLIISTSVTDPFIFPKEIAVGTITVLTIIFLCVCMINDGEIKLRKTPLDVPILIFALVLLLSALISKNQFDSLIAVVPILFALFSYFILINLAKTE